MSAHENGGPAFPRAASADYVGNPEQAQDGMTLRDYFAAKAMQGYCSREGSIDCDAESIAYDSYRLADYMLAARGAA